MFYKHYTPISVQVSFVLQATVLYFLVYKSTIYLHTYIYLGEHSVHLMPQSRY